MVYIRDDPSLKDLSLLIITFLLLLSFPVSSNFIGLFLLIFKHV